MNNDTTFWEKIWFAAKELQIPESTFRMWKSRKKVPDRMVVKIFNTLSGTPHALTLEQLTGGTAS